MSAPDKIYLQWADEESDEDYNEITWCVDQIDDTDVEYSRVTLAELTALRRVAEAAEAYLHAAEDNPDVNLLNLGIALIDAVEVYRKCVK